MWTDINGFEGLYRINEYGDVINADNEIIKPYISNKGYKIVTLSKHGIRYKFLVHRLVAIQFIPNPNNYPIVLHKDNNKLNTYYENLKWGTYSENNAQAINDGLNTIPRPDNNRYFRVFNNEENNEILCYGIHDLMNTTEYPYGIRGMYNYIYRRTPLNYGPYKNYYVEKVNLTPAFIKIR